jgi:hypothetical protein
MRPRSRTASFLIQPVGNGEVVDCTWSQTPEPARRMATHLLNLNLNARTPPPLQGNPQRGPQGDRGGDGLGLIKAWMPPRPAARSARPAR